jgi:isocitrate dehydrogenase
MEDGIHTYDIFTEGKSKQKVGTKEFGEAVIARLGQKPQTLKAVEYSTEVRRKSPVSATRPLPKKDLVGVDVYIEWQSKKAPELATAIGKAAGDGLKLEMIANRGVKVWPEGSPQTFCTDNFRCRFLGATPGQQPTQKQIVALLERVTGLGLDITATASLRNYDGKIGFTLAQGQ